MKTHLKTYCLLLLLVGCASKPVLYPNQTFKSRGEDQARADTKLCMDDADRFLKSEKGKAILKDAGRGSIVGGAIGIVTGIFSGDMVGSLGRGAAIGAAAGGAASAVSPDQLKQAYVNRCLAEKGYEVMGWR
jgi:hypothetical protein